MAEYNITKNIVIPPKQRPSNGPKKYPFLEMEIGDSFFVPRLENGRLNYSATHALPKEARKNITARKVTENGVDGVRYWRLA